MNWLAKENAFNTINTLGQDRTPFLFVISYDKNKIFAQPLDDLDNDIFYKLEDWRNYPVEKRTKDFTFSKSPIYFFRYKNIMSRLFRIENSSQQF